MDRTERLLATAKQVFPELWNTPDEEVPRRHKGGLTIARQRALDIVTSAVQSWEINGPDFVEKTHPEEDEAETEETQSPLGEFNISLPEDAALIQQVLTIVTFIDNDGGTAYVVKTSGEGLRTSWLGMCLLAQDYLMHGPMTPGSND